MGIKGCKHGDVCDQPFFRSIDFDKLEKKQMIAPFKPKVVSVSFDHLSIVLTYKKLIINPYKLSSLEKYFFGLQRHPMDVSNFDSAFTQDDALLTPVDPEFLLAVEQEQFKGFSFTNPNYTLPQ